MNSESMGDLANTVCLIDFHDNFSPPSVKTYPLVDFEFLESDIQLALLYSSKLLVLYSSEAQNLWVLSL